MEPHTSCSKRLDKTRVTDDHEVDKRGACEDGEVEVIITKVPHGTQGSWLAS